jgi:hypothetical protein
VSEPFREGSVRATFACMPVDQIEEGMHAPGFEEVIAPLERATGQRLNGPPRLLLLEAFEESPEGFRVCATKALRRAHTNPVGLLVKMVVKDGEHRRHERSAAPDAPRTPLERMLAWAEGTAAMLQPEHREEILDEAGLDEEGLAQVRAEIARSLAHTEADRLRAEAS